MIFQRVADALIRRVTRRAPDVVIGGHADPYLLRWWIIPRNRLFNLYLHEFRRSDDDRALHDHPWFNLSLLLRGCYIEHTIAAGGVHRRRRRLAGDIVARSPWHAHRIELVRRWLAVLEQDGFSHQRVAGEVPCWTLFITGPVLRDWGFHCALRGWVHWRKFTDPASGGTTIGRGCDQ